MKLDPSKVTIFTHPLISIRILITLLIRYSINALKFILKHILLLTVIIGSVSGLYFIEGPQKQYIVQIEEVLIFVSWWILLGVASSIGLGTGLHTFVLYLGPHIAKVTLVSYECNYVPEMLPSRWSFQVFQECEANQEEKISIWMIILAVQLESFLWGVGTALGELPPYFIARAAREANSRAEDLEELDDLQDGFMDRMKLLISNSLQKYGFITVLLCASIPNPLFDLAGLLCGHYGIPFFTFLGAAIIGKAFIKVHIQMIFTIVMFSEHHIDHLLQIIEGFIPALKNTLSESLEKQKKLLHSGDLGAKDPSILAKLWELFVVGMIAYFVISFINSIIQMEVRKQQESENASEQQVSKEQ